MIMNPVLDRVFPTPKALMEAFEKIRGESEEELTIRDLAAFMHGANAAAEFLEAKPRLHVQALAQRIADRLFTDGSGEKANRLVMSRSDGKLLGGWSKGPAADQIVNVLREVDDG